MNVCLLSQEWPPYGCGIGSYMYNLASGLVLAGHSVTVITHNQNPIPIPGIVIYSVPLPSFYNTFSFRVKRNLARLVNGIQHPWSWSAYTLFQTLIKTEQFDIIETADFGAWGWHFVNNGTVPVAVRCHTPAHILWSVNRPPNENQWTIPLRLQKQDALERMQTSQADGIAAPSEALAYHLSLSWVIPLSRFAVIPNPIDADLFCPVQMDSEKKEILYVGRLEFNKGVYDLAQAIIPVLDKYPVVSIRFVGMNLPAAELYRQMGETASEVILSLIPKTYHSRIHFTDPVPVADIAKFQQNALCAVMPTRGFESFSYTALEPMACGTPVIATRCGGPSEIITHGIDGLLVPPGKPKALSNAILQLLNNQELRSKLSSAARNTVEQKYALPAVIPKITTWYDEVINEFKQHQIHLRTR